LLAFQAVTLTDTEFLNGKQDGKPVPLAGLLRLPKVGPDKLPVVILLHGAGGMPASLPAGWPHST
jgi:hypothetical protein